MVLLVILFDDEIFIFYFGGENLFEVSYFKDVFIKFNNKF